jgi:hypothetical protein
MNKTAKSVRQGGLMKRLDPYAIWLSTFALGLAMTACFTVLLLSWPVPQHRNHSPAPILVGCCDVVITSSIDTAADQNPRAISVANQGSVKRGRHAH